MRPLFFLLRCVLAWSAIGGATAVGRRGGYIETEGSFMVEENWGSNRAGNSEASAFELGESTESFGTCSRIKRAVMETCRLMGVKDAACLAGRRGHQQRCSPHPSGHQRGTGNAIALAKPSVEDAIVELGESIQTEHSQSTPSPSPASQEIVSSAEDATAAAVAGAKVAANAATSGGTPTDSVLVATQKATATITAASAANLTGGWSTGNQCYAGKVTNPAGETVDAEDNCAPKSCLLLSKEKKKLQGQKRDCTVCNRTDYFPHVIKLKNKESLLAGKCRTPRDTPVNTCIVSGCSSFNGSPARAEHTQVICTRICKYGGAHTGIKKLHRKDGTQTPFYHRVGDSEVLASAPECLFSKTSICVANKHYSRDKCHECVKLSGAERHTCRIDKCVRESCKVVKKVSCYAIVPYVQNTSKLGTHWINNEGWQGNVTSAHKAECELVDNPCMNIARIM